MDKSVTKSQAGFLACIIAAFFLSSCTGVLLEDIVAAVESYKAQNTFHIVQSSPTGTNVPVNSEIVVTFSTPVKQSTITGKVTLTEAAGGTPVNGNLAATGESVTFTPLSNLAGTTEYEATVKAGITDSSGNALSEDFAWTFTTSNASAPTGSITVDSGNSYSQDSDVALTFSATDDTTPPGGIQMRYSNSSSYVDSGWEAYTTDIPSWLLVSGEGTKTVYAWFKDGENNVSNRVSDTIVVDSLAPINGSVVINSDAPVTNNTNVTLTLYAEDPTSGLDKMRISNSSAFADNNWVDYAVSSPWTINSGSGTKTVYVWFKDNAGNRSASPVSDDINLDTDAPSISTRSPVVGATNVSPTTNISVTFNENIDQSTITTTSFKVTDPDNITQFFTLSKNATGALLTSTGKLRFNLVYTVHVTSAIKDAAGNPFAGTTWTFTTRNALLSLLGTFTADSGDAFSDLVVNSDVAYIAANGTTYGQVYRVSVSNPASMGKTHKNDITSSRDTNGIAVFGNRVYAAQNSARLYQMDAANLNELSYGSVSYIGDKVSLSYLGYPFIIDSSGRLIGFSQANLASSGVHLPTGSFETVKAIALYGSYSYVGDVFEDMSNSYYIREVYTAEVGGGTVYIDETLDVTSLVGDDIGDTITGMATHGNDLLFVSFGPGTGVMQIFVGDDPISYLTTFGTLSNANDVSVAGNYAFVACTTTGIGLIEVNNGGSESRVLSNAISIGSGYYPNKLFAYTNAGNEIIVFTLAKTSGSVVYLRALRLD